MKILRRLAIALAVYIGLGLTFDALVGFFQPGNDVLRVYDAQGKPYDRVLSVIEDGVAVRFHRLAPSSEWLLVEARADVATDGLIGFHNKVWSEDGRLVASGGGTLLCRPRPEPRPTGA